MRSGPRHEILRPALVTAEEAAQEEPTVFFFLGPSEEFRAAFTPVPTG